MICSLDSRAVCCPFEWQMLFIVNFLVNGTGMALLGSAKIKFSLTMTSTFMMGIPLEPRSLDLSP